MNNAFIWYHYLISKYGRETALKIITEYFKHTDKNDSVFACELIKAINQDKNNKSGGNNNGK